MIRLTLFCAFVVSQLAATAAFLTASPTTAVHRFHLGTPPSRCYSSLHQTPCTSNCQSAAHLRLPYGTSPRQQQLAVIRLAPDGHTQQARCGRDEQQQPPESIATATIPGLSELQLQENRQHKRAFRSPPPAAATTRFAALTVSALAAGLAVAVFAPGPATAAVQAAAEGAGEHLHVGQKIANFFRRGGLPDWATLMTISAMPVVELRGGVPVGIWMGMPIAQVFGLCVAGNMLPIPVILLALRSSFVQRLAKPVLDRARAKAAGFGDAKSQAVALTLFVGIPLPGTGAWTGAMGAFLLGMPFQKASLRVLRKSCQ